MFVNDVCAAIEKAPDRPDAFRYTEDDAFPVIDDAARESEAIGLITAETDREQADLVGAEIARLIEQRTVIRDRHTGVRRPIGPGDIGVLFRTRESHSLFEAALARHQVPYYVYKGLGFFDAEEVKDVLALVSYLAEPYSNLRAAAFLRSRLVRISDEGLKYLAPGLAAAVIGEWPATADAMAADDRERLELARASAAAWIDLADQLPPAELVDRVLADAAYAVEMAGPGFAQARENLKKVRGLIRRIQNRGYATLGRLSDYFASLVAGGDESNAIIDAADAVNLMTVHAAKGLEFPVVFIVNIGKGSGNTRDDVRVTPAPFTGEDDDEGEPLVAVSDHELATDRDDEKEVEETKRLLYVAMTRARDRLYLCGTASAGKLQLQRGSLGRVLPPTLPALMAAPGADEDTIWQGASSPHRLKRVAARFALRQ
jgi:ATP-dependent helicase/nuclease subunit A